MQILLLSWNKKIMRKPSQNCLPEVASTCCQCSKPINMSLEKRKIPITSALFSLEVITNSRYTVSNYTVAVEQKTKDHGNGISLHAFIWYIQHIRMQSLKYII